MLANILLHTCKQVLDKAFSNGFRVEICRLAGETHMLVGVLTAFVAV